MPDHPTQPNLRCRNCWRPYAMHEVKSDSRIQGDAYGFWCPARPANTYEPDDSPEGRVYAAVEELIAAAKLSADMEFEMPYNDGELQAALYKVRDAARSERKAT